MSTVFTHFFYLPIQTESEQFYETASAIDISI